MNPRPDADQAVASPAAASCPRCGRGFHCGVNDGQPCACGSVTLDGPLRAVLRQRYSSCLCGDCLLRWCSKASRSAERLVPPASQPANERTNERYAAEAAGAIKPWRR